MSKENLVSIIVPVFKAEAYLERCIKSIQNQTHKNIEIILVDDGSPDGSPALCDGLAKSDKRIKVVHKKNGGVSSARNAGLEIATGKYVCFVDSDDEVLENYCDSMLNDMTNNNAEMVITPIIRVGDNNKIILKPVEKPLTLNIKNENDLAYVLKNTKWQGPCNKMYLRKKITSLFPLGIHYGEDSLFNLEYFKNISNICVSATPTYVYYENENSLSTNHSLYVYKKQTKIINDYYNLLMVLFNGNKNLSGHFATYGTLANIYFTILLMIKQKMKTKEILTLLNEMYNYEDMQTTINVCTPMDKKSKLIFNLFSKKKFRTLILFTRIYSALKK